MTDNFSKRATKLAIRRMINKKAELTGTGVGLLGVGRLPEEIGREGNGQCGALTRMGMMWLGHGMTGRPLSISS